IERRDHQRPGHVAVVRRQAAHRHVLVATGSGQIEAAGVLLMRAATRSAQEQRLRQVLKIFHVPLLYDREQNRLKVLKNAVGWCQSRWSRVKLRRPPSKTWTSSSMRMPPSVARVSTRLQSTLAAWGPWRSGPSSISMK